MKQLASRIVLCILATQLVVLPAMAEQRNFNRPTADSPSGMSFRKGDMQEMKSLGGGTMQEQEMITKGMMMTEPSMSGLTYQVHILGEIKNPGTYRITASDRLSEVLLRAGGIGEQG